MNCLVVLSIILCIALLPLCQALVFDSNGGFSEFLYGRNKERANGLFALSGANRLRERAASKLISEERKGLAAKEQNGAAVSARNRIAGEQFLSDKSMEEFMAENFLSTSQKFAMNVLDESAHDAKQSVRYRSGSELNVGERFAGDQRLAAQKDSAAAVKAGINNKDAAASISEVEAEEILKKQSEEVLDKETEIQQESFQEGKRK